jgi:hypothetical protein
LAPIFNPFHAGAQSDWLALIPFVALAGLLYFVGRKGSSVGDIC